MSLSDRTVVIETLQLIEEDLVRALKVKRIFRENKDLFTTNPETTDDLKASTAMQVSTQASKYRCILNEALQIRLSVQEEMRKL